MNAYPARAAQESDEIDLRWALGVLRQRIVLIAVCLLLALLLALAITSLQPPVYASTTTLFVEPAQGASTTEYNMLVTGERLAITYSQMLESQPVLEQVLTELGIAETAEEFSEHLTAIAVPDTQLIRLTARANSTEEAQRYANTTAGVFIRYIQALESARYQNSLNSLRGRIDSQSEAIQASQAEYDELNKTRIQEETEQLRLENTLADLRSDYQALQDDHQSLQMQVDQLSGSIYVVQPAVALGAADGAEVLLLVGQAPDAQTASYTSEIAGDRITKTYRLMLTARPVLSAALERLEMSDDPALADVQIAVEPVVGTQLLRMTVSRMPGEQAAQLANTIVAVFNEQHQAMLAEPYTRRLDSMQQQLNATTARIEQTQADIRTAVEGRVQAEANLEQMEAQLTADRAGLRTLQQDFEALNAEAEASANAVIVTEEAITATNPVQGRLPYLLLSAVIGLLAGVGLAFVVEQLNDRIRTQQDVRQALGVSPLGSISQLPNPTDSELSIHTNPSVQTEEFWLLSTSIRLATLDRSMKSLLITSPTSAEGKSLVAANLAATFARSGERVIAIDADLHFPRLHQIFGLPQERGLTNLLLEGDIEAHLKDTEIEGLRVLTSGDLPGEVVDIFSLPRLKGIITEVAKLADLIVVDSPPVLAVADTSILASFMDSTLLVLRSGKSSRDATRNAIERLRKTQSNLLGVVLNGAPPQPPSDYHGSQAARRTARAGRPAGQSPD